MGLIPLPRCISPWKKWEKKRHDRQQEWFRMSLEDVKTRIREGRAGPSFARTYLEPSSPSTAPFNFNEVASTLGMLSVAAVYTLSSPLQTFIRTAVLHPQWYIRVQDEVDEVCGEERTPEVQDTPRLPVLRAFIKECLRWRPPIPIDVECSGTRG
ncbi:cytochrome P450 [Leptodontidium sp. MPI-SDFR-AT-0119]|nr:cytochrome P450 [Leptodontidium sp. MPI-SDFR-AT-0119]